MPEHRTPSEGRVLDFVLKTVCPNVPRNLQPDVMDAWAKESGALQKRLHGSLVSGPGLEFLAPKSVKRLKVPVNYDLTWDQALGDYELPQKHVDIRLLGAYDSTGKKGVVETEMLFVNFGETQLVPQVLAWGVANYYHPISFREVLAVGSTHPKLHDEFGCEKMTLWSLKPCSVKRVKQAIWISTSIGDKPWATMTWMPTSLAPIDWIGFYYRSPLIEPIPNPQRSPEVLKP